MVASVTYTAETLTSVIVALGDFNPAIISPDWLEKNGLIGKDDADSTRENDHGQQLIISHQVSAFETDWFALQVLEGQFSLTSKAALSPAFKDLAVGIFQLLPHTPVRAVGLNFIGDFKLHSLEDYYLLGDVLAPKDIWDTLYPDEPTSSGLGELMIRIQPVIRGEKLETKNEKQLKISPSKKIKIGALLSYNDHHDVSIADQNHQKPAEKVAEVIDNEWGVSWEDAVRVFDCVLTGALKK